MFVWRWLLFCLPVAVYGQDPFEIQVFEYEPLPLGAHTLEAHLNYVADGTTKPDGPVAPEQGQFHASTEWTAGITDQIRAGFTLITAFVPGLGIQYAGFRVLPHFYAPRSGRLPLNLGFVAEFSFERPLFDQDTRQVELRFSSARFTVPAPAMVGTSSRRPGLPGRPGVLSLRASNITATWAQWETCSRVASRFTCYFQAPIGRSANV